MAPERFVLSASATLPIFLTAACLRKGWRRTIAAMPAHLSSGSAAFPGAARAREMAARLSAISLPNKVDKAAHGLATGKPFQAVGRRPLEGATSSACRTARDRLFTRLFARLAGKGSHDLSQHPLFFP